MKNYWLDRKNLFRIVLIGEDGASYKVPVFIQSHNRNYSLNNIPCMKYILSTGDLFVFTRTIDESNQITEQIMKKYNPIYHHPVRYFHFYYITHMVI